MRRLVFTVNNDLTYDQRMSRICCTLAANGYQVTLIGRTLPLSVPLTPVSYDQKRLPCFFRTGFASYAEFNIRLFISLIAMRHHAICAIDLDTMLPCLLVSAIRRTRRVYDAHELFCEMKEVVSRPRIYAFWKRLEKWAVPKFRSGYTVSAPIAEEFKRMYNVDYQVIRNVPVLRAPAVVLPTEKYLLYQGAVNEGRSLETLIPAMKHIDLPLWICGDGNFMAQARSLVEQHQLTGKVIFKGAIHPDVLRPITASAWLGVALVDNQVLNNYYSLANRFFDYIHAGLPQLCADLPAYRDIVSQHPCAILISDLSAESIAKAINSLLRNQMVYKQMKESCENARHEYNWQREEKLLLSFYENLFLHG